MCSPPCLALLQQRAQFYHQGFEIIFHSEDCGLSLWLLCDALFFVEVKATVCSGDAFCNSKVLHSLLKILLGYCGNIEVKSSA